VTEFGEPLRRLVEDMAETMYAANGAGLAAIQVGSPLRLFIVEASVVSGDKANENDPPKVFANPKLEWLSDEKEANDEGCLSFPGVYVPIKRSTTARVRARDVDGNEFVAEGSALYARALQHEQDHLDNRLIIDFVGPIKRQMIKRKMERLARGEEDDDEDEQAGAPADGE